MKVTNGSITWYNIDYADVYHHFHLITFFRNFRGDSLSFLALFFAFEFLHNLHSFIDEINLLRQVKASPPDVQTTFVTTHSSLPMVEHYRTALEQLRSGTYDARPEVFDYLKKHSLRFRLNPSAFIKKAVNYTLEMLSFPKNIILAIEQGIAEHDSLFNQVNPLS